MHARRRRAEDELEAGGGGGAPKASSLEPCPKCKGMPGNKACGECRGVGHAMKARDEEEPAWMEALAEFMTARRFVERHGLLAWMRLNGEPAQEFLDGLDLMEAELARLEFEERKAQAKKK